MKCENCGRDNPNNARFCRGCGKTFDDSSSNTDSNFLKNFRRLDTSKKILFIAIFIVLLVALGGVAMALNHNSHTDDINGEGDDLASLGENIINTPSVSDDDSYQSSGEVYSEEEAESDFRVLIDDSSNQTRVYFGDGSHDSSGVEVSI
ncbi:MAG: hypothetical protein IKE95_00770 [Methanobrevibacter sp.]|nr:hypothetical protein [Methanobrevibacter sp.]